MDDISVNRFSTWNQKTGPYPIEIGNGYAQTKNVEYTEHTFRHPSLTVSDVAAALKVKDIPADMGAIVKTLGSRRFLIKKDDAVNLNIDPVVSITLCQVLATCPQQV